MDGRVIDRPEACESAGTTASDGKSAQPVGGARTAQVSGSVSGRSVCLHTPACTARTAHGCVQSRAAGGMALAWHWIDDRGRSSAELEYAASFWPFGLAIP